MSIGKIQGSKTMMFLFHAGTAEDGNNQYDLALSNANTPIITSEQTGKHYTLSWDEILALAIEAGIDEPQPDQQP